jgi:hypothetical protein
VGRSTRWLIFAPVAILALFAPTANAEPIAGLNTTYYVIDEIPPTRSEHIYTVCGSEVENNINRSYDGEPFEDCTDDLFMVHMTGFIEIPEHDTIEFWLASDDGGIIDIGGNEWGDWWDQGCTWMESGQIDISAGSQPLDLYMYENGGGSCLMLAWNIDGLGFEIVPDEAFTTNGIPADTTTTIQETTTTWTTTTSSTTTTTTTTTTAPSTTVPVTNPSTTTTPQTTSTLQPEPTMPDPPATVPPPQISPPTIPETMPPLPEIEPPVVLDPFPQPSPDVVPDPILETVDTIPLPPDTIVLPPEIESFPPDTLELPPEIVDIILDVVDTMPLPLDTMPEPPDTMPLPPDTLPDAPETLGTLPIEPIAELPPELVEALLDAGDTDIPLTEEQFDTVVDTIENLAPEEAVALITQILATAVTPDQAEALASNPEVLAVITEEQATEIFETIEVAALDETQIAELTAAIQDAPLAVQEVFEQTIDIFGGFDDYVPTGSNIPVGERRTLIAIAAGTTLTAAGSKIKRK